MMLVSQPVVFFLLSCSVVLFLGFIVLQRLALHNYFTEFTLAKSLLYAFTLVFVIVMCLVVLMEIVRTDEQICDPSWITDAHKNAMKLKYKNPSYFYEPCRHIRLPALLYLTREECSFGRRLLWSVFLGGVVGWERREADRPAGIRTMSLVSLGACLFSINSAFAFLDGPMAWDSSRVSAAIPSGVGFLGAGLIFKEADKDEATGDTTHVVHGLTTAGSIWLSAAIGVACSGQLYFSACFTVALNLLVLRFGPRQQDPADDGEDDVPLVSIRSLADVQEKQPLVSFSAELADNTEDASHQSIRSLRSVEQSSLKARRSSIKRRTAALGGIV